MKHIIRKYKSIEDISEGLIGLINELHEGNKGADIFSIALSGGTTPKNIFGHISAKYKHHPVWKKLKIFFVDERCVPPDHAESNYKMINESLIGNVAISLDNIYRIEGENEPEEEARRYGLEISRNLPETNRLPQFDLVLLGIGEDGHTASIFPDRQDLLFTDRYCEVAIHPQSGQKRITITGRIINNARKVIIIATGKSKSEVIKRVVENDLKKELPASNINPVEGELIWMLDYEAAGAIGI